MRYGMDELENIALRNQTPQDMYYVIPFNEMSKIGRLIETESKLAVTKGKGGRGERE